MKNKKQISSLKLVLRKMMLDFESERRGWSSGFIFFIILFTAEFLVFLIFTFIRHGIFEDMKMINLLFLENILSALLLMVLLSRLAYSISGDYKRRIGKLNEEIRKLEKDEK